MKQITSNGHVITDEVREAMAAEAEAGYELSELRRRPGRRTPLACQPEPKKSVEFRDVSDR